MFDVEQVRGFFPVLDQEVHGRPLIYFDNAATMQMPEPVLQGIVSHYHADNANVHRGIHELSNRSTAKLEGAREEVAAFLGADSSDGIVFTAGTTASLNLVASSLGLDKRWRGARIVTTYAEHHSNFVPWQQLAKRLQGHFEVVGLTESGELDWGSLVQKLVGDGPTLLALTHASNVTGAITDVKRACALAHQMGATVVVDAAQSAPHLDIDVQDIGCDFLAFSGHKLGALTGVGVLYIAPDLRERLLPASFGGEMVDRVEVAKTTFERAPLRFEPGTPNYVGAYSLAEALRFMRTLDWAKVREHESSLVQRAEEGLRCMDGVRVLGNPERKTPLVSFVVEGVHSFDLASVLDAQGVAVRSGSSCAQPLLRDVCGVETMTRMSFAYYNTLDEVDRALELTEKIVHMLA